MATVPTESEAPGTPVKPGTFTIATTGRIVPRRWWQVRVHPDVEHLREAAHKLRPEHGRDHWNQCFGVCHPVRFEENHHGQRKYPANGYAGLIRFATEFFTAEVVAHELVHAAAATYRMNVCRDVHLGADCGEHEEQFAYIYGELYNDLERQMWAADGG